MNNSEPIALSEYGKPTVTVTKNGETFIYTEGVDYDRVGDTFTFREGVLSPLPDGIWDGPPTVTQAGEPLTAFEINYEPQVKPTI